LVHNAHNPQTVQRTSIPPAIAPTAATATPARPPRDISTRKPAPPVPVGDAPVEVKESSFEPGAPVAELRMEAGAPVAELMAEPAAPVAELKTEAGAPVT
jgi:hypothetical protein